MRPISRPSTPRIPSDWSLIIIMFICLAVIMVVVIWGSLTILKEGGYPDSKFVPVSSETQAEYQRMSNLVLVIEGQRQEIDSHQREMQAIEGLYINHSASQWAQFDRQDHRYHQLELDRARKNYEKMVLEYNQLAANHPNQIIWQSDRKKPLPISYQLDF